MLEVLLEAEHLFALVKLLDVDLVVVFEDWLAEDVGFFNLLLEEDVGHAVSVKVHERVRVGRRDDV